MVVNVYLTLIFSHLVRVLYVTSTTASAAWTEAEEEEAGAFDGPV